PAPSVFFLPGTEAGPATSGRRTTGRNSRRNQQPNGFSCVNGEACRSRCHPIGQEPYRSGNEYLSEQNCKISVKYEGFSHDFKKLPSFLNIKKYKINENCYARFLFLNSNMISGFLHHARFYKTMNVSFKESVSCGFPHRKSYSREMYPQRFRE
ncbi:hypothetical protein L9F63_000147, partial [Diploptera punctata]